MCLDPLTIAAATLSGFGAVGQAKAANAQADYNASVAENNAKTATYQAEEAQRRGEEDVINQNRKTAQLRGEQRATMAARGLDLTYGTPQSLIDQTDYFGQVDANTLRDNAAKEAYGKRVESSNYTASASAARASKTNPLFAGLTAALPMVAAKWTPTSSSQVSLWSGSPVPPSGGGLKPSKSFSW
jgi:hypothetical protein